LSQLPLNGVATVLTPASQGQFDAVLTPAVASLSRRPALEGTARRVAAGGASHAAANDVRRTPNLFEEKRIAARRITTDIVAQIAYLRKLGLGYLSQDRSTTTLSPGGLQRLRLATQIRSNLAVAQGHWPGLSQARSDCNRGTGRPLPSVNGG